MSAGKDAVLVGGGVAYHPPSAAASSSSIVAIVARILHEQSRQCPTALAEATTRCPPWCSLLLGILLVASAGLVLLWWRRRRTYRALVRAGLPTVFWRPRFVRYELADDDDSSSSRRRKLSAGTITNVLPRMRRLRGPYRMYGTVYGVSTGVVHVAHPVPALAVLGGAGSGSAKAPAYDHFKNFCGDGVFTADDGDGDGCWRGKRAAVLHALLRTGAGGGGESFHGRVRGEAERAAAALTEALDRKIGAADGGVYQERNIVPVLQRATIGLIYRFITHTDLSALEQDTEEISTVATAAESDDSDSEASTVSHTDDDNGEPKPESLIASYLESITRIRMIILAQSRSIWFLLPRWCYTTFASLYRAEEETMGPIREVAARAIERAEDKSPLGLLQQTPLYKDQLDGSFSKNLMDEAITLLFAGQDTSAATLSWTLHLLTVYPEVQAKLAREVCREMEGCTHVTKKLIARMPYLDAVIKEAMRLYPVAPFVVRKVTNNIQIAAPESNTKNEKKPPLSLPIGSLACIWIYSLHRNPEFWHRPDDFRPERWLRDSDDGGRDKGITTPGAYMPFAAGPRNCVGQPLANVILRTLLARLIHRYEFRDERVAEQVPETEVGEEDPRVESRDENAKFLKDMQAGFTVLPQGGLPLEIRLRMHEQS